MSPIVFAGARRPVRGAGRRRQHRPRGHDDPRHVVRPVGPAGTGARGPRSWAGPSAAPSAACCSALATVTFGVDHIVAGIAINLLAPGVTRFLSSEVFVGNGDGTITQSPHDDRVDRALHVPVPRRREPLRLEDAGRARLAGRQALVLRLRRCRAGTRLHQQPRLHDDPRPRPLPDLRLRAVAHAVRPAPPVDRREAVGRRLARRRRVPDQVHRRHDLRRAGRPRRRVAGHRRPGLQRRTRSPAVASRASPR